jgi:hypothetical protein
MTMEPLPETREALEQLEASSGRDVLTDLTRAAETVRALVPSCVGISLSVLREGLTFTLVATGADIAALDGVQYAAGGPCVDAVMTGRVINAVTATSGPLDEDRWAVFARAGAARGVSSTLSMPVHRGDDVSAGVNLYASTVDAFDGHHDEVAAIMGAWAPGAVRNADLGFATEQAARQAPRLLEDRAALDQATGIVMARQGVDEDTARDVLRRAAERSGTTEVQVAQAMVRPHLDGTAGAGGGEVGPAGSGPTPEPRMPGRSAGRDPA